MKTTLNIDDQLLAEARRRPHALREQRNVRRAADDPELSGGEKELALDPPGKADEIGNFRP
jgi:hypothetical protein